MLKQAYLYLLAVVAGTMAINLVAQPEAAAALRIKPGPVTAANQDDPAALQLEGRWFLPGASDQGNGMYRLDAPGTVPLARAGFPDLGGEGMLIALPPGYQAALKVTAHDKVNLPVVVEPHQARRRCGPALPKTKPAVAYQSKATWPANPVRLEPLGYYQDVQLMRVAFYPHQQNFAAGELVVTTRIEVQVDFVRVPGAKTTLPAVAPATARLLRTIVANADQALRVPTDSRDTILVVSSDELAPELERWVTWKEQRGYRVQLATLGELGDRDDAQAWIQAQYDAISPRPTHLVLVGDGSEVPVHNRRTSDGWAASDYPYTLLSGDDAVPDLIAGRFVAANRQELGVYLDKVIAIELNQAGGWAKKATTIASREGSRPSDEGYAQMIESALLGHTYNEVDRFYERSRNATATNITAALNQGRSWLTYVGHGSGTSWGSTNGSFGNTQIDRLSNSAGLPVLVDVACLNGSFVRMSRCFGKAWMIPSGSENDRPGEFRGAAAYYGASVSTSWVPPAVMAVGAAQRHVEQELTAVGATVLAGQLYLFEQMGVNGDTIDNLEWYNLFGDPTMLMQTDVARAIQVAPTPVSEALQVRVADENGEPVAGATVTLRGESGQMAAGVTNQAGQVTLGQSSAGGRLTVSGANLRTVVREL